MGRNHARVLQSLPGVELVAAVDPRDPPPAPGDAGRGPRHHARAHRPRHRSLRRRHAHEHARGDRPRTGGGRDRHARREAVGPRQQGGADDRGGVRPQRRDRVRRAHRTVQPRAAGHAAQARTGRARDRLPDRHPAPRAFPRPHRRRRSRPRPGDARHRPDGVGDGSGLPSRLRAGGPQEWTAARGPGERGRGAGRRDRGHPSRQLAVPAQGAGHRSDGRARMLRRRHDHGGPDLLSERDAGGPVGPGGLVPRGDRRKHDPLRDPEAGTAHDGAGQLRGRGQG